VAKSYDFDKEFLLELEPCSMPYKMYEAYIRVKTWGCLMVRRRGNAAT
jgi:hypothetical protein